MDRAATTFRIGDDVRVTVLASEWMDARGMIVEIVERPLEGGAGRKLQECAVLFGTERRWFMADHLAFVNAGPRTEGFRQSEKREKEQDPSAGVH